MKENSLLKKINPGRLAMVFAFVLISAALAHFISPDLFIPFIPEFVPFHKAVVWVSGIIELGVGVLLLVPRTRRLAGFAVLLLMWMFLPIHLFDLFKDVPAIGSTALAIIRIPVQFLLIGMAWWMVKNQSDES